MKKLLSGNEAIARGAYEYGVTFAASYPGTPSTEILENIAQYSEISAQWCANEKVALDEGIAYALGGKRVLISMKHVGLNVASDTFMVFPYCGTNGGLVIVSCDDPGMHSSQNEQDNRYYAKFGKIPLLEPSSSQEAKEFVGIGLEISEKFKTPVLIRMTTRTSHAKGVVELGERKEYPSKRYKKNIPQQVVPVFAKFLRPEVEEKLKKLQEVSEEIEINKIEKGKENIGVITSGISYQYAKEVLPLAWFLKLGMPYPLPVKKVKQFCAKFEEIWVVEEGEPFLEESVKILGITKVKGKEKIPNIGELDPQIVASSIKGEKKPVDYSKEIEILPRPPMFCIGCPHRGVFYVLKKLNPLVTGDIGCYTLGCLPPYSSLHTTFCMGASVGNAFGFEKVGIKKVVGVIGDSTFIHGGIPSLIDIVYNKGKTTIIILDNKTTGMTGHQDHPGTGKTLKGEITHKLNLMELVSAIGVKYVKKVNPYNLKQTQKIIKEALNYEGPAVIITEKPCIMLKEERRKKRIPFEVDASLCTSCGSCFDFGCPAMKEENNYPVIDELLCVGCSMCVQLCKNKAIKVKKK